MNDTFTVKTRVEVDYDRVASLIISALEGGSNYWYTIAEFIAPDADKLWRSPEDSILSGEHVYRHVQYPLSQGGALIIHDKHGDLEGDYRLDLESIARGLQIMAEDYARQYADFLSHNEDADTGDLFLQCCLFGRAIFG